MGESGCGWFRVGNRKEILIVFQQDRSNTIWLFIPAIIFIKKCLQWNFFYVILWPCYGRILCCCLHLSTKVLGISGSRIGIFVSAFNTLILQFEPQIKSSISACINRIFFFSSSFLTFPKTFKFYHERPFPHFSTLFRIVLSPNSCIPKFHEASTISEQRESDKYISLNWIFLFPWQMIKTWKIY